MKINYDKYSQKYYFNYVKPMTFEQLEQFKEELQAICSDVYTEQLAELNREEGCDGCKI